MASHIELRDLRLFLGVSDAGGFSACARQFGLSQPALSRAIQQLEARIGARLFERDSRRLRLTPAGETLKPLAERMLRDVDTGLMRLEQFVRGGRPRLVIAALPSVAAILLPPAIARLKSAWPDLDVELLDALAEPVGEAVRGGRADIGLTIRPNGDQAGLTWREIARDPFGLVCRPDDPLAAEPAASWRALAGRPFIAMSPTSSVRKMTDAAFAQIQAPVRPLYECAHLATTGGLIEAGLGISALPKLTLPLLGAPGLAWIPLCEPDVARSIGVLTRADAPLSAAGGQLVEELARDAGEAA